MSVDRRPPKAIDGKLSSIKDYLENGKLELVVKDSGYYLVGFSTIAEFCNLCSMNSGSLYRDYVRYFTSNRQFKAIQLNVEALQEVSSNGLLASILSFSKEAGEDFGQSQTTKRHTPHRRTVSPEREISENGNIIDKVLTNLEDMFLILRFIKRENLDDLFNQHPMIGVEFTRIYESTKNRLESNGIIINDSRVGRRIDIDSSIRSIKCLSILTEAILNDKKIQKILERNTNIFTIITEYLFGIIQTPS